jgi:cell filamentation protein
MDDASSDPVYPNGVLINRAGLQDQAALDAFERLHTSISFDDLPDFEFGPNYLSKVHHHLFQDVYSWAGQYRTCSIAKPGAPFVPPKFIRVNVEREAERLTPRVLDSPSKADLAKVLGLVVANLNVVHPFREGNGRAIRGYMAQAAQAAGFRLDYSQLFVEEWMKASVESFHDVESKAMERLLERHLEPSVQCSRGR